MFIEVNNSTGILTKRQIKQILYEHTSQQTQTHHSMRLGLALMTSSAIVQINIHDSTILMWYGYLFKKEDLSSKIIILKTKTLFVVIKIITFLWMQHM